ncbi:MAG: RNA polymerase sigma-70 factor [Mangrovibacterium sp.]
MERIAIFIPMQLTDDIREQELTDRICKGDRMAFDIAFRRYYPGLVIFASQFTLEGSSAEEIVQDFFVKLWEKRSSLTFTDSMKSYFFTSVKNRCFNYLKHKKIEMEVLEKLKSIAQQSLLFDPDVYVTSELQERITQAVNTLPRKCREVFIMSRFKGMKNDEIARELNLSKRTVETHISNAINSLRHDLRDYADLIILAWFLSL